MNDAATRDAFEKLFPLPPGVMYRHEQSAYCVFVDNGRDCWMQVNGAFHVNQQFKVWQVASSYYAPTEPSDEQVSKVIETFHEELRIANMKVAGFALTSMRRALNTLKRDN